jgi:hypothetical protein
LVAEGSARSPWSAPILAMRARASALRARTELSHRWSLGHAAARSQGGVCVLLSVERGERVLSVERGGERAHRSAASAPSWLTRESPKWLRILPKEAIRSRWPIA